MCLKKRYSISTAEGCLAQFPENSSYIPGLCPPIWDNFLCWPPTFAGEVVDLPCPANSGIPGIHKSNSASRTCGEDGMWLSRNGIGQIGINGSSNNKGWTNYSQCFQPNLDDLARNINDTEYITKIARGTRMMEMFGLSFSMITLLMSLFIFCHFRNLWNNRTRIHQNLFIAMGIQVLVRLILYSDQYVVRSSGGQSDTGKPGIENQEYLCECFYSLLEYARTAMFLWMFVEGLYLHNMITVAVFQERLSLVIYYIIGWGAPLCLTIGWAIITAKKFGSYVCWFGYNLDPYYWILEGPRLTVISLNLLFLLNIIRVLVTKLRESNSTEAQQVRKAVRAAIVLLPLLGITNSIQMIYPPLHQPVMFAIWSYLTTFLTSFQGFFCALIYCFLNGEVQCSVSRFLTARKSRQRVTRRRSVAAGASLYIAQTNGSGEKEKVRKTRLKAKDTDRNGDVLSKRDPFFENWSDVELSSHNHVDIEQIEIPLEYLRTHNRNHQCVIHSIENVETINVNQDPYCP